MLLRLAPIFIVYACGFLAAVESVKVNHPRKEADRHALVERMRIGKASFDAVRDLHNMWYVHSLKGLLVQMAKELVQKLNEGAERDLLLCLHRIPSKTDIVRASECLVAARSTITGRGVLRTEDTTRSAFIVEDFEKRTRMNKKRARRRIQKLTKMRKTTSEHMRFKRSEHRLVERPGDKKQRHSFVRRLDSSPDLMTAGLTPIQQFSRDIVTLVNGKEPKGGAWGKTYKSILKMKKGIDAQWKSAGARVYDLPMDRLVFDKNATNSAPSSLLPTRSVKMPDVVERAFSLADSFRAHLSRDSRDANVKMLSPRFAPVMPDKHDGRGSLSPSILAFYKVLSIFCYLTISPVFSLSKCTSGMPNEDVSSTERGPITQDDAEDQIVPLPSLLKATGMKRKDRDSLLEMIMEVSGARTTVDAAFETLNEINLFGVEGPFLEVTKKLEEAFHDLEKSFTRQQKREMSKRKFAFLSKNQLQRLYVQQGITDEHHADFDLDAYDALTPHQREEALWRRVEIFAMNKTTQKRGGRVKRQSIPGQVVRPNELYVLAPTVLEPYMFKPIYGLSVLGPTVLSPSLFSPLILNPAVGSPYVLSPAIGMPFILSPYLLSPYVLSPMVFDPFILSPYVLSPNVVNPYVLSPLILSPLVLCPDVLSPMVLGGNILSPSLASPSIFTKNTLTVSVLSPSFLS
ncbi:hypothetical protein PRIPAC_78721 [Pristionchus pacificus]|uniref:Uncharacterized protein n=1 Tax=Pristionchus pacificus TaxID=54126 RepID=A0A2A6CPD1_PRIPA|nr:hypothetical protein PRIPAC_78721 [Pristionchus pacificus]|eukprot:PDM80075.1 hypothetical protein PRIPAC_32654 [Pristionchus pacificus]